MDIIIDCTDKELRYLLNNIELIRKEKLLSKKSMAKILGVSVKTINKIEQGVFPPRLSVSVIFKLHKNFGVLPYELFLERR